VHQYWTDLTGRFFTTISSVSLVILSHRLICAFPSTCRAVLRADNYCSGFHCTNSLISWQLSPCDLVEAWVTTCFFPCCRTFWAVSSDQQMRLAVQAVWFKNGTAGRKRSSLQEVWVEKLMVAVSRRRLKFLLACCVCGCGCCVFLVDRWQNCTKLMPLTEESPVQTLLERLLNACLC